METSKNSKNVNYNYRMSDIFPFELILDDFLPVSTPPPGNYYSHTPHGPLQPTQPEKERHQRLHFGLETRGTPDQDQIPDSLHFVKDWFDLSSHAGSQLFPHVTD